MFSTTLSEGIVKKKKISYLFSCINIGTLLHWYISTKDRMKMREFLTIRIDPELHRKIKIALINRKTNVSEWVREQITNFLASEDERMKREGVK